MVIPKDVRDALGLAPGATLRLTRHGQRIVLEASATSEPKISYEEFRRRVPRYEGPPVAVEDMSPDLDFLWRTANERDRT